MKAHWMRKLGLLGTATVVVTYASAYAAHDANETNFSGIDPSKRAIVEALKPGVQPPRQHNKLKGLSIGSTLGGAAAVGESVMKPKKASFDQIRFELNSDRLTPQATKTLDRVGEALLDRELDGMAILVEGHTDASGGVRYNMSLSQRRAETVKRYLVDVRKIDAGRLHTAGKGPTELMDKDHPNSGVNRRVVFVAATAAQ